MFASHGSAVSDIPRPEHAVSVYVRMQRRIETARDRMQLRRRPVPVSEDVTPVASAVLPRPIASMIPGVVAGAVVVLLGLGGMWAWQSWSNRVNEPIDDRLPLLFASEQAASPTDTPGAAGGLEQEATLTEEQTAGGDPAVATTLATSNPPESMAASSPSVVVHVAGAVSRAGVVELGPGARVIDALQAAGGATHRADLDRVNLAAPVWDGERIHVPAIGEDTLPVVLPSSGRTTSGPTSSDDQQLMLDLNTASAQSLEELPGVGPSTAAAIVRTRESRGPFLTVQELLEVPGIGETKLSQIELFVRVGG